MTSRHNRKGSLSMEEIKERDAYCEQVKQRYEYRKKSKCLKNLLKPAPVTFFRARPSDAEIRSKIVKERMENMQMLKPESIQ